MSDSTDRVLSILEFLAAAPERPRVLREFSSELSLPTASCSRILNSLVRRGYAEKNGSRGGYRLGPMAYVLSSGAPYMRDVSSAAGPLVRGCAEKVEAHVLLAAKRGGKVYKIAEFDGNLEVRVRSRVFEELYSTATGRLLLAFAGGNEEEDYVNSRGLPGKAWEGCGSYGEFKRKLAEIRQRGFAEKKTETLAAFAYPVGYGGEFLGLGCSMIAPGFGGEKKKRIMTCVRKTAEAIEKKLERRVQ